MVGTRDFLPGLESPPKNPRAMSLTSRIQAILKESSLLETAMF